MAYVQAVLSQSQHKRLRKIAIDQDIGLGELVREVLINFIISVERRETDGKAKKDD